MIVKEYSCKNCIHKTICYYEKDMTKLWDKMQSIGNNNFYPLELKSDLSLPSVCYYSLKCKYFEKQ